MYRLKISAKSGTGFFTVGSGFPFSRLRAEALQRAGTGMTSQKFFSK